VILVDFTIAEVFASALDQQPEHKRRFADEGEPRDID
jgi:hypothetical protein